MEAIAALICVGPTVWEIINDRKGETKKDKVKDLLIAVILYAGVALLNWKLIHIHPLKSIALMLAFRMLAFDYIIQWILIRRGIISGSWFSYTGKTARWDRWIAKVHPWVRMVIRLVLFLSSTIWFFK